VAAVTSTDTPVAQAPDRTLVGSRRLREMLPVGRTTFYRTIARPDFPVPVQVVDHGPYLWYLHEVEAWLETRRRRPGAAELARSPATMQSTASATPSGNCWATAS
jgi:predicted DNA-binding transcriptional regulator AlpA